MDVKWSSTLSCVTPSIGTHIPSKDIHTDVVGIFELLQLVDSHRVYQHTKINANINELWHKTQRFPTASSTRTIAVVNCGSLRVQQFVAEVPGHDGIPETEDIGVVNVDNTMFLQEALWELDRATTWHLDTAGGR